MHTPPLPLVPQPTEDLRILGVTIIDGTGAEPVQDGEILIENGRLAYVGQRRDVEMAQVRTVELPGKTVLPGFIDTHTHAAVAIEDAPAEVNARFPEENTFAASRNLHATLMAGVTTTRDLGGLTLGYRRAIAAGDILGPRTQFSIAVLSPTGGHADTHLANGKVGNGLPAETVRIVDSDDDMRVTVRELFRSGADWIKVCTTGGVSSPSDTPHDLGVPAHHIEIAIEEGLKRQGQRVTSHAQGARGILEAIRGGVASVEHGYEIDDEGIELMIEKGTYLVPTLTSALRVPERGAVPDFLYEKKVVWSEIARTNITRAFAAGVQVAMGTDSGICPHGQNLKELGHMVSLGLTPMQAIQAGTLNAAKLMRLDADLGTLEAGKVADLAITEVDPLTHIGDLADPANVKVVVQGGGVVKDLDGWMSVDPRLPRLAGAGARR